jgi:RNA polymerase sigma-70 factor (ECF subfamily)
MYNNRQSNGANDTTDEALIIAIRNNAPNKRAAASQLAGRYFPVMEKYAELLTRGNKDLADDIVNNTFLKADTKLHTFKIGEYSYQTWLKGIAKNEAINLFQRDPSKRNVSLPDEAFDDSDDPEIPLFTLRSREVGADELTIRNDLVGRILDVAERLLSDSEKQLLTMHYGEDKSIIEIAGELGVPENTVKSHLSRARARLRESTQVQQLMGRVANPYGNEERLFDDALHNAFTKFVRVSNPSDDLAMPNPAKFEILLAEARAMFQQPVARGFAIGWLKHLVYGKTAPQTEQIDRSQQQSMVTNLKNRVRAMYGA